MELGKVLLVVIGLAIGAILLASILPTAMQGFYNVKSNKAGHVYGRDASGSAIVTDLNITDDTATSAIFQLLPLFAVLGALVTLMAIALKDSGFI